LPVGGFRPAEQEIGLGHAIDGTIRRDSRSRDRSECRQGIHLVHGLVADPPCRIHPGQQMMTGHLNEPSMCLK
jgi:hypothetical protein